MNIKALKNLKIGTKIIAWFVFISCIGIIASIVGAVTGSTLGDALDRFQDVTLKTAEVSALQLAIERSAMPVNDIIITGDLNEIQTYKNIRADIDQRLTSLSAKITTPEAREIISGIKKDIVIADTKAQKVFETYRKQDAAKNMEEYDATAGRVVDSVERLHEYLNIAQRRDMKQMDAFQEKSQIILLVIVLLVIIVSIWTIFFVKKRVVDELREMFAKIISAARSVADSTAEISVHAENVSETCNQMNDQIDLAASLVTKGSVDQSKSVDDAISVTELIRTAIGQVAIGAQNQATSVSETLIGINKLTEAIDKVSGNAHVVSEVANSTKDTANQGKDTVGQAVTGMRRIKETVHSSANKIQALGEKSKQIGEIIKVIDDIAEQTNLLALNAAIEAARAGEHGKGFAVVADEVRKLAERSAKATREIAELIKGVQMETMQAVEAMGKGMSEVERGSELAENAGNAIDGMMTAISDVVRQINEVSRATEEMARASSQVSQAMDQIAAVTEENTAATEEVSASVDQVADSMTAIAEGTRKSAELTGGVSDSVKKQTSLIDNINSQVESLACTVEEMYGLVAGVRL